MDEVEDGLGVVAAQLVTIVAQVSVNAEQIIPRDAVMPDLMAKLAWRAHQAGVVMVDDRRSAGPTGAEMRTISGVLTAVSPQAWEPIERRIAARQMVVAREVVARIRNRIAVVAQSAAEGSAAKHALTRLAATVGDTLAEVEAEMGG